MTPQMNQRLPPPPPPLLVVVLVLVALLALSPTGTSLPLCSQEFSSTTTSTFDQFNVNILSGINATSDTSSSSSNSAYLNVTLSRMFTGFTPTVSMTVSGSSLEIAQSYSLAVTASDGSPVTLSALASALQDTATTAPTDPPQASSSSAAAAAAALPYAATVALTAGLASGSASGGWRHSAASLAAVTGFWLVASASAASSSSSSPTCQTVVNLQVLLDPIDYAALQGAMIAQRVVINADNIEFVEAGSVSVQITVACNDPAMVANFPLTCAGSSTPALAGAQPVVLSQALLTFDPVEYPSQKCALDQLQANTSNIAAQAFLNFSCAFVNLAPDGVSSCGGPVLQLSSTATIYASTQTSYQIAALTNLQRALEQDSGVWVTFVTQWRGTSYCVDWTILSDGNCGPTYGNAGCDPNGLYCCSPAGQ